MSIGGVLFEGIENRLCLEASVHIYVKECDFVLFNILINFSEAESSAIG